MKHHALTLVALFLSPVLFPCSGGEDPDGAYYSFFEQEQLTDKTLLPLLRTYYEVVGGFYQSANVQTPPDPNVAEWKAYWGGKPTEEDIRAVVYGSSLDELKSVQKNLKKPQLLGAWASNTVVQQWASSKEKASIAYLLFAKRCEPHLTERLYDWNTGTYAQRDRKAMLALVAEGKKAFGKEKNAELKLRYAFQIVRLLHYTGTKEDGQAAIDFFNASIEPLQRQSYLYYRALEHIAGVYYNMNRPEAPYLYAKVFVQCPDRRMVCVQSFRWVDKAWWTKALAMCQNDAERVAFHALRGLCQGGFAAEEMENIARIDPNHSLLELLLLREINRCEREAFLTYWGQESEEPLDKNPLLPRMRSLCRQMSENQTVKNRDLWRLSEGYLLLFMGQADECRRTVAALPAASAYAASAQKIDFVAQLLSVKKIDANAEKQLAETFKKNNLNGDRNVEGLLRARLAQLYYQDKQFAKSFLCHNKVSNLSMNLRLDLLDQLLAFARRKEYNPMEAWLMGADVSKTTMINDLLEMRGTYYLERGEWDKAIADFKELPLDYTKKHPHFNKPAYLNKTLFGFLPQWPVFSDPVEKQVQALYAKTPADRSDYNKLLLAQTLQELERKAQSLPDSAALYYMLIANALTNTSPYGWHRPALSYYTTNYAYYGWNNNGTEQPVNEYRPKEEDFRYYPEFHYFNGQRILDYYNKAYNATQDKEMRAKITFAAAHAEQYAFYSQADWNGQYTPPVERDAQWLKSFQRLKYDLNGTKYYQEVLKECAYFMDYVEQ